MRSGNRKCILRFVFPGKKRRRKKADRPVPKPVKNLRSFENRGCCSVSPKGDK